MENNDLSGFKQSKDVLMYYHTSLRNIGLYTSISLAGLSASRTFFKKNTTNPAFEKPIFLLFMAFFLIFNFISIQIARVVMNDIKEFEHEKLKINCLYKQIPTVAYYVNITAFTLGLLMFLTTLYTYLRHFEYSKHL